MPKLCADRAVVLAAVQKDGLNLEFAARELRDSHEVVLAAVQQHGDPPKYTDAGLDCM